jgi:Fe-S cluster assembly iron-binding protein IscA
MNRTSRFPGASESETAIADDDNRLRVSDRARSRILGILQERRMEGTWVRLFAETGSLDHPIELALAIDEKRPGDQPIADDLLSLVADGESVRALAGLVLDYEESMAFHGFTLCRERLERSCAPSDFAE